MTTAEAVFYFWSSSASWSNNQHYCRAAEPSSIRACSHRKKQPQNSCVRIPPPTAGLRLPIAAIGAEAPAAEGRRLTAGDTPPPEALHFPLALYSFDHPLATRTTREISRVGDTSQPKGPGITVGIRKSSSALSPARRKHARPTASRSPPLSPVAERSCACHSSAGAGLQSLFVKAGGLFGGAGVRGRKRRSGNIQHPTELNPPAELRGMPEALTH